MWSAVQTFIENKLRQLLNVIMHQSCVLCGLSCDHQDTHLLPICGSCQLLIDHHDDNVIDAEILKKTNWQHIIFFSTYSSPVKELIAQGKFEKKITALKSLGYLFATSLLDQDVDKELVLIPVPLHKSRFYSRGFNQSLELALPISKALGLTINNRCVKRTSAGKTQHFLSRKERQKNAKRLFEVVGEIPKKIVIIDDIYTTGATMTDLCLCLKGAGAMYIEVWIIARTLKQRSI